MDDTITQLLTDPKTEAQDIIPDPDGLPPGMTREDYQLIGQLRWVTFQGKFYALQGQPVQFDRQVRVSWAVSGVGDDHGILVLQDYTGGNFYVIDRKTNKSLGCQMEAYLQPEDFQSDGQMVFLEEV